jgi:tRNA(adenine34) deaminase
MHVQDPMVEKKSRRRWSAKVATVSTRPPKDLFTKDAATIARTMARRSVSPKGPGSGVRMIQFFINRAGRSLSAARRRELEKAKRLLQERNRTLSGPRTTPARPCRTATTRRRRST